MSSDYDLPAYLRGLIDYNRKEKRTVVGLHSGTSADGPTALAAHMTGSGRDTTVDILACETYEYESHLRERVFDVFSRETATVDRVAQADNAIAEFFAAAADRIVAEAGLDMRDVDLIVSYGQSCYQVVDGQRPEHNWLGDKAVTAFLDIGAGGVIAELTGITTVFNLRQRDIAAGGIGVPTVPYGDWVLFTHPERHRSIHNIGGIANPTVLPAGGSLDDLLAFDTGPGNMIIDAIVGWITEGKQAYDTDGRIAAQGTMSDVLLAELMDHPFIRQPPPKGAARQLFGHEFSRDLVEKGRALSLSDADLVATATAFTAESIAYAYREFILPRFTIDEILLAGGGANNHTLVEKIRERLPSIRLDSVESLGIPVQAREVLSMMIIGNETVQGRPGNAPAATGAAKYVISGDIAPGEGVVS